MIDKAEVYSQINSKGHLRFELNESNEKEYLNKLISVQQALKDVEQKNKEAFENKIKKIGNLKEEVKQLYKFFDIVNKSKTEVEGILDDYILQYMTPIEKLEIRKEKLQLQVVPYVTNGFWQRVRALFTYEGRAKLNIEKQFNKELKSLNKELKELKIIKEKNQFGFDEIEDEVQKGLLENLDCSVLNQNEFLNKDQISELKSNINTSRDVLVKNKKNTFINGILDYIEVCTDYLQISDLNVSETYKFKNTEYKLYLQEDYLDNDFYSVCKYFDIVKSENDFIGKQAANKLIEGIQESIDLLEKAINEESNLKLA